MTARFSPVYSPLNSNKTKAKPALKVVFAIQWQFSQVYINNIVNFYICHNFEEICY